MIERLIKTSQGNDHWIRTDDPEIVEWFTNKNNCTDIILDQINNENFYGPIFAGRSNMTIVDLGANIGLFSLYAADSASTLYAVEPSAKTFSVLTKLTSAVSNIVRTEAAISFSNDPVTFFTNENPTVNSLLDRSGTPSTINGVTLEAFFNNNKLTNVDFVKCDIEGSEVQVLTDELVYPIKDIVKFWFIEVHQTNVKEAPWPGNLQQNRERIESIMRNIGYNTEQVINDQLFVWK